MGNKGTVLLFGSTTSEVLFDIQRAVETAGYTLRLLSCKRVTLVTNLDCNAVQVLLLYLENIERHHYDMIMDVLKSEAFKAVPAIVIGRSEECQELMDFITMQDVTQLARPTSIPEIMRTVEQKMEQRREALIRITKDFRKTVWIVDSDPKMLTLIRGFLANDYQVRSFFSNAQLYSALREARPTLIVANYQMPGSLGNDMIDAMRSIDGSGDVPVVFTATSKERLYAEATLPVKPVGFVAKPVTKRQMLDVVMTAIGK